MTILEMNIYNTLLEIEAEKAMNNIEPILVLLIGDNLYERVQQRIGQPVTWREFTKGLHALANECKIHLGDTPTDQYAKIIYREILSSL